MKIWITIDVEAHPNRAEASHVDRLIWGRFDQGEFGVGRMMDVADTHDLKLTMFIDLAEIDSYGEQLSLAATEIHRRNHDLQLHVHAEFFAPEVWSAANVARIVDLNEVSSAQSDCIVKQLVSRYKHLTGAQPLAFRGGGYRFNEKLLDSLGSSGIIIDSSINRARPTQVFPTSPTKQFLWPNGVLEVPVSVIDGFRNIPRPFDLNFNTAHFPSHKDMMQYLAHFEAQFGKDAIAVLVMHSWSFLDISSGAFFGPPLESRVERFSAFIEDASKRYTFVTAPDIIESLRTNRLGLAETIDPRNAWPPLTTKALLTARTRTLEKLSVSFPSPLPEVHTPVFRTELGRGGITPLEEFGYPWHTSSEFRTAMEDMLAGRWVKAGYLVTDMRPPINFDGQDRPHACDLHSWEPVGYALRAYEVFDDKRYLEISYRYAFDWLERYFKPVMHRVDPDHLDTLIAAGDTFAWYDMAVGRRIYRMAYILDVLARHPETSESDLQVLWNAIQFHHAMLARDHFFRSHSNHGLSQALGQYAAAKRFFHMPDAPHQLALARNRVIQLLNEHFTPSGVHKEHSPGYHYGLMTSLLGARASGLLTEQILSDRITAMEQGLSFMIMPNGQITPIGDTDPVFMARSEAFVSQFTNSELKFQMSCGILGTPPSAGVKAYLDAGYAFARLYAHDVKQEPQNASYLAQIAAFHSRVHKHADHLSFVWHDKNRDILIDPGRYAYAGRTEQGTDLFKQGFWYSDPKRIYCESTRAHNTIEIDGQSFQRAKVKPFGSALVYAGEEDGCAVTYCEATHFRSIRHNRHIIMEPGRFLLVLDWLYDRTGVEHDYRQFFHFADGWQVASEDGMISAHHQGNGVPPLDIRARSLIAEAVISPVVRGQEKPELLGWLSDKANSLIPTSCFHVHKRTVEPALFATLFVFGKSLEIDQKLTRFNNSMTVGQAVWMDDYGSRCIKIQNPKPEERVSRTTPGYHKGLISIV